jgi:hypothetical protein
LKVAFKASAFVGKVIEDPNTLKKGAVPAPLDFQVQIHARAV